MLLAALVAFGHFLAFFAMTSALVLELALLRESLTGEMARRIQRADRMLGIMAVLVLILGSLRVFYFEKGADYYLANHFFQIKILLFFAAGIISIYPTLQFIRWNHQLKQGQAIELSPDSVARLKKIIHWELILIGGILLCASLMAKGFGV